METITLLQLIGVFGISVAVLKFIDWYILKATEALRSQIHSLREDVLDINQKFAKLEDKIDRLLWHSISKDKHD
jgi:hypothetical protein